MAFPQLLASTAASATSDRPQYSLLIASDDEQVRAAQRLRYDVFAGEMGARLHSQVPGLDVDRFDEFCDHVIVRCEDSGEVVGTYRMLPPERAVDAGGMYSDSEFDLSALGSLRSDIVEIGRSCVHPEHRNGSVIGLVWAGLAQYLTKSGKKHLGGCTSIALADGGREAAGVWDVVSTKHYADEPLRVHPTIAWDVDSAPRPQRPVLPPLMRGYVRLGAEVLGRPAHDADFGVADFYMLLSLDKADPRYLKFFLGDAR